MSNRNGNHGGANGDYRIQNTDQSAQNSTKSTLKRSRDAIDGCPDCPDCPKCTAIQEKALQDWIDRATTKARETQRYG
jgi:hypothetical protein